MPELRKETLHFLNNETVTEADIAEVRRGNVIDIGVSTAAITYMRVNNQGQEELVSTELGGCLKAWRGLPSVAGCSVGLLARRRP